MIENFNTYLFNRLVESVSTGELDIFYSFRLRNLFASINDGIAKRLLTAERNGNYTTKRLFIDFDDNDEKRISFLMINKVEDVFGEDSENVISDYGSWRETNNNFNKGVNNKLRGTIGINQFVNEIFNNEYISKPLTDEEKIFNREHGLKSKPQQLEDFVNRFKSYRTPGELVLVSGKDIIKWYNGDNYTKGGGDLNSSCMRYNDCSPYIEFYSKNKDMVSLLIMKDKENSDLICGRALIWKLSKPDDRTFMDRIYTVKDHDAEAFKQYAKEQGWLHKYNQNMQEDEFIIDTNDGSKEKMTLIVDNIKSHWEYPYMDTFKYYFESNDIGELTNNWKILPKTEKKLYKLESTEGSYYGGYTYNGLKEEKVDIIMDDIIGYIYDNDRKGYNFWNFVDNKKFIEKYKDEVKERMFKSFNNDFSIGTIREIIGFIQPEYSESIKDMTEEQIDYYLSNDQKKDIVKYHIDKYYSEQGITPKFIFERMVNSSLRNMGWAEYRRVFGDCFDEESFINSIVDNYTIYDLLN